MHGEKLHGIAALAQRDADNAKRFARYADATDAIAVMLRFTHAQHVAFLEAARAAYLSDPDATTNRYERIVRAALEMEA